MLPIRHKTIFKSRWMALLWAGGILWTAVDFAGGPAHPSATSDNQGDGASAADAADVQAAVNALDAVK